MLLCWSVNMTPYPKKKNRFNVDLTIVIELISLFLCYTHNSKTFLSICSHLRVKMCFFLSKFRFRRMLCTNWSKLPTFLGLDYFLIEKKTTNKHVLNFVILSFSSIRKVSRWKNKTVGKLENLIIKYMTWSLFSWRYRWAKK